MSEEDNEQYGHELMLQFHEFMNDDSKYEFYSRSSLIRPYLNLALAKGAGNYEMLVLAWVVTLTHSLLSSGVDLVVEQPHICQHAERPLFTSCDLLRLPYAGNAKIHKNKLMASLQPVIGSSKTAMELVLHRVVSRRKARLKLSRASDTFAFSTEDVHNPVDLKAIQGMIELKHG